MKIIFAPDSFKGTFSSSEIIEYLEKGAKKYFDNLEVVKVPIADGGEGTVDAIISATGGKYLQCNVTGPLGDKVNAKYGLVNDIAVIEMAEASGITLVDTDKRNPLFTTTYGTGELILEALNQGAKEIIIGIGGSATNDGGIGMAQALGVHFYDKQGNEVGLGGQYLEKINSISLKDLDDRFKNIKITVICDVTNPLTGPCGATYVYGPQKGGSKEILDRLEEGMTNYKHVIEKELNIKLNDIPGTGAAGGLGAALVAFLGGKLKPGIETILDLVQFESLAKDADLVITGEGRLDGQSIFGKVPTGIGKRCKNLKAKVIVIAGSVGEEVDKVYNYGIDAIFSTIDKPITLEEALNNSNELLVQAIDRMYRLIKLGMDINNQNIN